MLFPFIFSNKLDLIQSTSYQSGLKTSLKLLRGKLQENMIRRQIEEQKALWANLRATLWVITCELNYLLIKLKYCPKQQKSPHLRTILSAHADHMRNHKMPVWDPCHRTTFFHVIVLAYKFLYSLDFTKKKMEQKALFRQNVIKIRISDFFKKIFWKLSKIILL